MGHEWDDFMRAPAAAAHGAQVYAEVDELADSVAGYLLAGFDRGQPAFLVATPQLRAELASRFEAAGWAAERLAAAALLTSADAETALGGFVQGGRPSAPAFFEAVGRDLDGIEGRFPSARIRVFGETVDILCARGEGSAAAELELLWNALARARGLALLCGYRLDVFDRDAQLGALRDVCGAHSHVLPAADADRFADAVDRALADTLGPARAGHVYAVVGQHIRRDRVPAAQLVLMWVSENMPVFADRILDAARANYVAAA